MEIPQELLDLGVTSLEQTQLDLSRKHLCELPESIGILTNLKELNLYDNDLTSLPDWIGNLTNLEKLSLGSNKLTSFPESFGNLTKLETLDLSKNKLTSLPDWIGNLTELETLDLYYNNLYSLPKSLMGLEALYKLYLVGNDLSELPEDYFNDKKSNYDFFYDDYEDDEDIDYEVAKLEYKIFGDSEYVSYSGDDDIDEIIQGYAKYTCNLKEHKTKECAKCLYMYGNRYNKENAKTIKDKVNKMIEEMDEVTKAFLCNSLYENGYGFKPEEKCEACEMYGYWDNTPEDCFCDKLNENNLACDIGSPFMYDLPKLFPY